ncbi:type III restriction protein res subunit [Methanococcus vannielii SB]|uniref:Type III restriction protein res subunit n=1 Tax=Methanococcus vannielii (strain ATCC 35089 / DSM 1224 / JCM 13029 / OCM 148 / SB) TaxID=406327 RepID=A6UNJ4_METVS|nr:DEAD/DEAH box helicase family protein [Methanococcus vannielii]ABR54066.1 type III restriction protein res subunit [Methanococcus vannielii SB]
MKHLHYKKQDFQEHAVNAVCDIFEGEMGAVSKYILDKEKSNLKDWTGTDKNIYAFRNEKINLSNELLLKNINEIQKRNGIFGSEVAESMDKANLNITIEMETGTGKTYTYINTIFELNKRYNWTKFIIVVPSIAIREGVYKSFEDMEEHFLAIYGKKINYFVFNSSKINDVMSFARDDGINVMIINNQAFNKTESNTIHNSNNEYGVAPIEYINTTNPIMIIDEPQSVEGKGKTKTKDVLSEFKPLFTLRYSATHRELYTLVYRLDAVDAFNKKLVKRIEVKGIEVKGGNATHGYFLVDEILTSKGNPKARIEIDISTSKRQLKKVEDGDNIYEKYAQLEQYKDWVIDKVDGRNNCVVVRTPEGDKTFDQGVIYGKPDKMYQRRIQIRELIKSHLNKESMNYKNGIKTISLFFIDEVAKYRQYADDGNQVNGEYAEIFVQEYTSIISEFLEENPELNDYLGKISVDDTHKGYFSIDKKSKQLKNPDLKGKGKEKTCSDPDTFELIMKDKKRLLDLKNPVRFLFSHSALKEGWDNPNVFQICILRDNESTEIKRRQEVGRGLRLCVNQNGERIDSSFEGIDVDKTNVLTIIANESYESFANALQSEFNESLKIRPTKFSVEFLKTQNINGTQISPDLANKIHYSFVINQYLTEDNEFTEKFRTDLETNDIKISESLKEYSKEIIELSKKVVNNKIDISKASGKSDVRSHIKLEKLNDPEFDKLWNYISTKSYYTVDFDTKELIKNSVAKINEKLTVSSVYVELRTGITKKEHENTVEFEEKKLDTISVENAISKNIKFDLISQIVDKTRLTKNTIIEILTNITQEKFECFKKNPEEFIKNISNLINHEKAVIIENNIVYHKADEKIPKDIFENILKLNPEKYIETPNNYLYDKLEYDSVDPEKKIGEEMDIYNNLIVFTKLPKNKYNIETPVGKFSPDWLMVFKKDTVSHAYCVFESKGSLVEADRREIENIKIDCAKKHFSAISNEKIIFDAVTSVDNVIDSIKPKATV